MHSFNPGESALTKSPVVVIRNVTAVMGMSGDGAQDIHMATHSLNHSSLKRQVRFWTVLAALTAPIWATVLLSALLSDLEPAARAGALVIVASALALNSLRIVRNLNRDH
jgi:predicted tellurium resistance membrane protein TerC